MPKFDVSKSIEIDAPIDDVYDCVRDFKKWPVWSPWLICEPDCALTFADDGRSYGWDGDTIGSGEIGVTGEDAPNVIVYKLTFLKPWKSTSTVRFKLAASGESTRATWEMEGSLPFFMFFMKGMMSTFIGMDYERGLAMLKDYLETGSVPSKLEFPGETAVTGCEYIGVKTECAIAQIGPSMERDLGKLRAWLEESGSTATGAPFSIYHKWKPTKGITQYTTAFPLASAPASPPAGFVTGAIPAHTAYVVKHTGAYRHLGNAWSAGIMRARAKVFAKNNAIHPFEIYESNADETPEEEVVTVLHFATK